MNKFWNKLVNMNFTQKIQLVFWFLSFVILIIFVILAATLTKGTSSYANTLAGIGFAFGSFLVISLFTTAIFSYRKGKRGSK